MGALSSNGAPRLPEAGELRAAFDACAPGMGLARTRPHMSSPRPSTQPDRHEPEPAPEPEIQPPHPPPLEPGQTPQQPEQPPTKGPEIMPPNPAPRPSTPSPQAGGAPRSVRTISRVRRLVAARTLAARPRR
jgi:hypothetical protein